MMTNPKTLTTPTLTITDPRIAFESFCVPVFCDFVRNINGAIVTSYNLCLLITHRERSQNILKW